MSDHDPHFPPSILDEDTLLSAWDDNTHNALHFRENYEDRPGAGTYHCHAVEMDDGGAPGELQTIRVPFVPVPLTPEEAVAAVQPVIDKIKENGLAVTVLEDELLRQHAEHLGTFITYLRQSLPEDEAPKVFSEALDLWDTLSEQTSFLSGFEMGGQNLPAWAWDDKPKVEENIIHVRRFFVMGAVMTIQELSKS